MGNWISRIVSVIFFIYSLKPFIDSYKVNEMRLEFTSNLPINIYFVPSEEDYNKFMVGEQYNTYQGCLSEDEIFGMINCNVTSGGMIIHNPNYQNITYTITIK